MRTGLLLGYLLCLHPVSFLQAENKPAIPPAAAVAHAGEKATVEFKVEAATFLSDRDDPICFLNSLKNFRSQDTFTAVIFSEGLAKFQRAGIPDPAAHFLGKTIQVTGVIGLRTGKAQIQLEYVGQIEIIDPKQE